MIDLNKHYALLERAGLLDCDELEKYVQVQEFNGEEILMINLAGIQYMVAQSGDPNFMREYFDWVRNGYKWKDK